jgi:transaldolase
MKIFIDSAKIEEIENAYSLGIVSGVTTNPTLIAKTGREIKQVISEICKIVDGDISAEVFSEDFDGMIEEGEILYSLSNKIVLKLPLTKSGLRACKYFSSKGLKTNVTLCFSANQALLAGIAGATYISPFIGRLDDIGEDGIGLIRDIKNIYSNYPMIKTQILAASIRNIDHVFHSASIGADAATMPLKIISDLYQHDLTDKGLEIFRKDILEMKNLSMNIKSS